MCARAHQKWLPPLRVLLLASPAAAASPPAAASQTIPFNAEHSLVFVEGENFTATGQWEAREWAKTPNYFASTVANVFHSRRAYLHGPSNATSAADGAAATVTVPHNGAFSVLARYEAPYRFEVPFELAVSQHSKVLFKRAYGLRSNLKVWGFAAGRSRGSLCGPGLQTECVWPWGATENMVWEGVGTTVQLAAGPAQITITPVPPDDSYCCWADRNIDVIMLHPNASDVERRVNGTADPADGQVLPLDGLFSQHGEVFFKIQNKNTTHNLSVAIPLTYDHAPYMGQHDYLNKSSSYITVAPGKTTGWIEVGGLMDTFNHGSWKVECGALAPPPPPPGNETLCKIESLRQCPMGPAPWNKTKCSECLATKECPGSCTVQLKDKETQKETYNCSTVWRNAACVPPPPPPPEKEVACWAAIAKLCAQNRSGGHEYAANQTECLHCAQTHAGCTLVPTPGTKKTHLECPMAKCPRACGAEKRIRDPETKLYHNITVCQELWFAPACKSMVPPPPPRPPAKPKKVIPKPIGPAHCIITVGAKADPFNPSSTNIVPLYGRPVFDSESTGTEMLFDASTRASRRMRHGEDDFLEVYQQMFGEQGATVPGKPPELIPIYGATFPDVNGSDCGSSGCSPGRLDYDAKHKQYMASFCKTGNSCLEYAQSATNGETNAYIDIRSCYNLTQCLGQYTAEQAENIATVSLGDEIAIRGKGNTSSFHAWCKANQVTLEDLGCRSWDSCPLCSSFLNSTSYPALYYWSTKYIHSSGIAAMKDRIDPMKKYLKKAKFGANFSPTAYFMDPFDKKQKCQNYIGWTFQWVRVFREEGLTLPWGEDWIWQTPVGSQQMMGLSQDAMRSGIYWAGEPVTVDSSLQEGTWNASTSTYKRLQQKPKHVEMLFYVMKHYPGNTNNSWTRLFFNDLSHGITRFDMFNFDPSTSGYTCDYVDSDGGAYPTVRAATNMLGAFEDIVHAGAVQPYGAAVALLYSETADIFFDSAGTTGAELRALYIALKHAHVPIDVVIEEDCESGRLHYYDSLYITQAHMSDTATAGVVKWVQSGGSVFATASAGLLNQANTTNEAFASLLGITQSAVWAGPLDDFNNTVRLIKQDINFVKTLDNVTIVGSNGTSVSAPVEPLLAKGLKSIMKLQVQETRSTSNVLATFSDGSPAMIQTKTTGGTGSAYYCAFLPGLSYFADGAIPLRPVDRSSVDEGMNHFLPTKFAEAARELITMPLHLNDSTVVPLLSTSPFVESGMITASGIGTAMPCVNWGGVPLESFKLTLASSIEFKTATLASGKPVSVSADKLSFTFDLSTTADVVILR